VYDSGEDRYTTSLELTWGNAADFGMADDGQFIVVLRALDNRPQVTHDYTTVTVNNTAPTLGQIKLSPAEADEGKAVTLSGKIDDPGVFDTFKLEITWGDGSLPETVSYASGMRFVRESHCYADDGEYTIDLMLVDDDGGGDSEAIEVIVNDVPPVVTLSGVDEIDEGSPYTLGIGAVIDPGDDEVTEYIVHWGDGSTDTYNSAGYVTHIYGDGKGEALIISVDLVNEDGIHAGAGILEVIVNNVAPVIPAEYLELDSKVIDEGGSVTLGGMFTDDGTGDLHSGMVYWGDGTSSPADVEQTTRTFTATHTYLDNIDGTAASDLTITAMVTDGDGGTTGASTFVTVRDVKPAIDLGGAASIDEGANYTLTLGAVTDPGVDEVSKFVVHWGDGFSGEYSAAGDVSHSYGNGDNVFTITVDLEDEDGIHLNTGSLDVSVLNVAPVLTLGQDQTASEGAMVLLSGTFTDPGFNDTHSAVIDWGDLTQLEQAMVSPGLVSGSHVYADDGVYEVTVTLTDDGGGSSSDSLTVMVLNETPTVQAAADLTVAEGVPFSLAAIVFHDPGTLDTHMATIDWGDGTGEEMVQVKESPFGPPGSASGADGTVSGSHTYGDNGSYTVTVTVTDDDGASASDSFEVTVHNVAPVMDAGADQIADEGSVVTLSGASFSDLGTLDTHTAAIEWGDGSLPVGGLVDQTSRTVSGTHVYADNGVYTVLITITDDDGASAGDSFTVTVLNVGSRHWKSSRLWGFQAFRLP